MFYTQTTDKNEALDDRDKGGVKGYGRRGKLMMGLTNPGISRIVKKDILYTSMTG